MMTKPELEASLSTADTWVQFFAIVVAIGTVGAAGFGVRHWLLNKKVRALERAESEAHQAEIARLMATAEGARRDVAAAQSRIAEANARAAEANEKAEAERLARVRIEARLAPRRLSIEQQRALVAALRPFTGQRFWVIAETADRDRGAEQVVFSNQLTATLVSAGWVKDQHVLGETRPLPLFRPPSTRAVEIGYADGNAEVLRAAQALASGLTAVNVDSSAVPFTDLAAGIVINVGLR